MLIVLLCWVTIARIIAILVSLLNYSYLHFSSSFFRSRRVFAWFLPKFPNSFGKHAPLVIDSHAREKTNLIAKNPGVSQKNNSLGKKKKYNYQCLNHITSGHAYNSFDLSIEFLAIIMRQYFETNSWFRLK